VTFNGRGTVVDAAARTLRVDDGTEIIGTKALLLATGSSPRSLPGFDFDGERILSSDHVLNIDTVPGPGGRHRWRGHRLRVRLLPGDVGSDVTVLEALPQILTGVDKDAADVVVRAFKKRGIKVQTGCEGETAPTAPATVWRSATTPGRARPNWPSTSWW